jgi:hypothetical protein
MGPIREPLDVDFYVDPRPLTEEDRRKISEFVRKQKLEKTKPTLFAKHSVLRKKKIVA